MLPMNPKMPASVQRSSCFPSENTVSDASGTSPMIRIPVVSFPGSANTLRETSQPSRAVSGRVPAPQGSQVPVRTGETPF